METIEVVCWSRPNLPFPAHKFKPTRMYEFLSLFLKIIMYYHELPLKCHRFPFYVNVKLKIAIPAVRNKLTPGASYDVYGKTFSTISGH